MPVVPYYCGRPARIWIAAMSGPEEAKARAAAASAVTGTSPASAGPVPPAPRPKVPEDTRAFSVTVPVASPWATWASNWFVPHCQPSPANHRKAQCSAETATSGVNPG